MNRLDLLSLAVFPILLVLACALLKERRRLAKRLFRYEKKKFLLSRAEHKLYDLLLSAVGEKYRVFAQVHLPTVLEHKIVGQNWQGAFRHINGKSVDFVLCDKNYVHPVLAIELDDATHDRPDRQERDREVERIFQEAGLPLLRIRNHGDLQTETLKSAIMEKIDGNKIE